MGMGQNPGTLYRYLWYLKMAGEWRLIPLVWQGFDPHISSCELSSAQNPSVILLVHGDVHRGLRSIPHVVDSIISYDKAVLNTVQFTWYQLTH